jgi:hypothetical protein
MTVGITQTHTDARPIVPPSIVREIRQQQTLQQNRLGVRTDIERTPPVIAEKRRPPGGGLESREETPKEGIYEPKPAPDHYNAAAQQLRALSESHND